MKIKKPIFIIGQGRSGTTILYRLFVHHIDTAYFEHFATKYYKNPNKFFLFPILFKLRSWRRIQSRPKPMEGGQLWNKFFPIFEPLNSSHATDEVRNYYYSAIKAELKSFNAKRFVSKYPPNSINLPWTDTMFPDAYYILIRRDPKASVCSLYKKMQEQKNLPDPFNHWSTFRKKYCKGVSDLEACINFYNTTEKILLKDLSLIKERTIQLEYENLVEKPRLELKRLYKFTELDWYKDLEEDIPEILERGNNEKWKSLPNDEREILEKTYKNLQ